MRMTKNLKIKKSIRKLLAALLTMAIFLLAIGMTQETLGKFSRSFLLSDSALSAEFDVTITTPEEFWSLPDESNYEYFFLSDIDFQGLTFQITNNGETDILLKPHIDSDITYRIFIDGESYTEFVVPANETIEFWLIIAPIGLDTTITDAKLFFDILQVEGGLLF